MIRKFTFNKSIWLYIFLLISSFKITNAKDSNSFRTNVVYMGIVNGNLSTMVLSVPELNENTVVKNAYTSSNKITPLDPVLRACVSTTPIAVGSTMSATITGNNTASGYTTQFVLLDATNKIVAGPQATASFAATVSGIFKIVAVNYSGSVTGLTIGQNISSISGTCWEISAPKCFDVQAASCTSPIQIVLGNALTASISGNNTTSGFITEYVLTDENDVIVQGALLTPSFTPSTVGAYKIYAVNYSGTITGLTVGNNFLTGVLGNCMAKSAPKCFTVICPTVTNIASNNTNPTSCGASDGSIKICGLPANSTGWTLTYEKNTVAASALMGQTADANGCITISGLSAGSYSKIKVSSAGCTGTNLLDINLSDPSSPSPPSGLNAVSNSLCTGGNTSLSATGLSGASYVWSVSPSGASLVSNSGVVNGTTVSNTLNTVTAGTYTVSVTQKVAGCISPAATIAVVVNGLSTAPSIVGSSSLANICPATTVDLTTKQPSNITGQTFEWHTVSSNPSVLTMVSNPVAVTLGTYYLYSKSTIGGCYSPASNNSVKVDIVSCSCVTSVSVVLGNALTATITGNNTSPGFTTEYVLTDGNDVIVKASPTASFVPTSTGPYKIYAINYSGTVTGLSVGSNFLTGITGSCVAKSAPKCFTVICPTVTNIASNNTNPTSCGASDGSIKICGLPANSTGWTLTYEKNTVAASALTGQAADANGCITISGLSAGSYSKIKVSSAGCTGTNLLDVNLSDPMTPSLPTVASASPNSICSGSSTTLSATCATGTLTWFTDAGLTGTPLASNVVSPTATTTYYASCVTGSCKSSAASVVVTVTNSPSLPTVANASPNSICSGNSTTLSATCATGTLTWFTDAGLTGTPLASNVVSPTATTTYYASCVTGSCKSSAASVVVTVTNSPSLPTVANASPNSICSGSSTTLSATCATGTLTWFTDAGLTGTPLASNVVSPTATTTYYASCVTGLCKSSAASVVVTVTNLPSLPTVASASPNSICSGNSTTLSATCATGTLTWFTDAGLTDTPLASNVVSPTATTTYYASCVTGLCKSSAASVVVTVTNSPSLPTVANASPNSICSGSSTTLSATCATGTLTWFTDAGLTGTPLASNVVSPTATTTYYASCVTGLCKSSAASVVVTVTNSPSLPTVANASPNSICSGSSTTLSATCATGTLTWFTDAGLTGTPLASNVVSPIATTTYYASCVAGLCKSSAASVVVTVTNSPSLPTVANASPNSICSGNSTTLSATCATGTLTWFTDAGLTGTPLASNVVSPTATTTYYASCVAGLCKSSAASVVVTVTNSPSLPTVANASPNSICSGSSTTLSATCATGTLTWFTDAGLTGTPLASNVVSPTATTTYYASCVTGSCKSSAASVVVTVNPVVTLTNTNFTKTNPATCNGTEGTIKICGLVANTSYSVSYNKNGASQIPATFMSDGTGCITITTLMAGTYDNFNVKNIATTCSSGVLLSVSLILSNPPSATITLGSSQNPSACGLNDGFIQLNGLTAGTAYTVNYMQNGMSQTPLSFTASGSSYVLGGLTAANYTNITVTSGSCISNPLSKSLSDPITTTITLGAKTNPTTCSGNEGTFTVSGLVPNTAYVLNYSKDGFVQTPIAFTSTSTSYVVSGLLSGSYTDIRVTNAGCTSNSVSTTLTDPAAAVISLGTPNNPSTCGGTDGSLTIKGLAPGTVYTIKYKKDGVWQTPITYSATTTSYTIEGLCAGAYSNISVSNNSCNSNSLSQMLVDPLPPTIGLGPVTQPNSCGANNGAVIITGLTTGLTYTLNYLKDGVQQTPIPFTATGTTYTINALAAGNYTGINVKQNTCVSNTLNVSLSNPGGAIIDVLGINPTSCSPGNDGKIVLSGLAQGLNYILNYSKNGSAQTQIPIAASSTSYVINGLTAAAYTNITVTQANCVSNVVNATLVAPKLSAAIVASISPICSGTSTTLEATCSTGTVKWYTDVNLTSQLTDATISPSATTTYYASCEVNGCKSSATPVVVTVNNCISSLKIVKSQTSISGQTVGSKITYSLVVTNTGNTTLTNVSVKDTNATLSGTNPILSLAPNTTAQLTAEHILTQADLNAGKVINVANVSGTSPSGSPVSAVSDAGTDASGKPITNPELVDGPDTDNNPTNDPTETILCPAPMASVNGGMNSVIICSGGTATLNATGCSSGTITWTSNPVSTVPSNGIVSPTVTTTYTATCTNGSCVSPASNSVTVVLGPCANPDGIISIVAGTKSIIPILGNDKNSDGTKADLAKITVPVVTTIPSKGTATVNPDGTISYTPNQGVSGTDTFIYTICDKANPTVCDTAKVTISIIADLDVKLQLKVFLQGAFLSPSPATDTLMRDNLRTLGVIPTTEPFTAMANSRFTKFADPGGQTIGTGVLTTKVLPTNQEDPNAIVDWVFVELRDAAKPTTVLKTRAALVQRDGDVVEASDGTTPVTFTGAVGTSYYVSVKHRNHLGAMTATPITMTATGTIVDFTTMTAAQLWDSGLVVVDSSLGSYDGSEQVRLGNGKMALWAGNANADNKVKYAGGKTDPTAIITQVITFPANTAQSYNSDLVKPVYLTGDINMDGQVKYQGANTDTVTILVNIISKYPNNLTFKTYNFDLMVEQIP